MKKLKGTQTEKNLLISFAGESQARNRYTFFSAQAKKDGFVQISEIFLETAEQELQHGKRFFKFLVTRKFKQTHASLRCLSVGVRHRSRCFLALAFDASAAQL